MAMELQEVDKLTEFCQKKMDTNNVSVFAVTDPRCREYVAIWIDPPKIYEVKKGNAKEIREWAKDNEGLGGEE